MDALNSVAAHPLLSPNHLSRRVLQAITLKTSRQPPGSNPFWITIEIFTCFLIVSTLKLKRLALSEGRLEKHGAHGGCCTLLRGRGGASRVALQSAFTTSSRKAMGNLIVAATSTNRARYSVMQSSASLRKN